MKVLFIGSDSEIVCMTAIILRRSQYEVSTAIGRAEAVDVIAENTFDLVILDCDMSMSDRENIIEKVKRAPNTPRLLLISGNKEDEIPALKAGADDWVKKPYKMDVLLARMGALLRQNKFI